MTDGRAVERARLVEAARVSIARGSKSFAAASLLFDSVARERAWLLYAWCRKCDDLADDQDLGGALGSEAGSAGRLAVIRERTALALAGAATGDDAFDALGVVAAECGLTADSCEAVIEGFALDAAGWRPASERDLMRYCWHVAGAVGVLMARVMDVAADDADTLDRAADLGFAFQLANIARDVIEDAAAGRCYLPAEWLAEEGITADAVGEPASRPALARIAARLAERAAVHEASARVGAARLALRRRWAVLAAAAIYGAIAREVVRRGPRAWDERVSTGKLAKAGMIAEALVASLRPAPEMGEDRRRFTRRDFSG